MTRGAFRFAAALAGALPGPGTAAEPPRLVFASDAAQFPVVGVPVRVDTRLVQVALSDKLVLAAGEGAHFLIDDQDAAATARVITVGRGPVLVVDSARQRIERLERGSYLVRPGPGMEGASLQRIDDAPGRTDASATRDLELRQGFQLGDAIMTRQQAYLDSIRIDVRDINRAFSSLLRAIAGK